MKILHVHREFEPTSSGVARHIDGLARATVTRGHSVTVYAPALSIARPTPYATCRTGLIGRIREADVVHVHASRSPLALGTVLLAQLLKRKVVYTPHCYYDHGSGLKRILKAVWDRTAERLIYSLAETVILLDESWRADVRRRGIVGGSITIIPNCIDHDAVLARRPARTAKTAGAPALIHIGRLAPVKRLSDAIDALAEPGLETAMLHLIGKGEEEQTLRARAAARGVVDRVVFHGWLDDVDATSLLTGADLSLLPSAAEGLPTALLEALILGIPVVASDIPGNRAVLDPIGWTAIHRVADAADLARVIRETKDHPLPGQVHQRLLALFTWAARADDVIGTYTASAAPTGTAQGS